MSQLAIKNVHPSFRLTTYSFLILPAFYSQHIAITNDSLFMSHRINLMRVNLMTIQVLNAGFFRWIRKTVNIKKY